MLFWLSVINLLSFCMAAEKPGTTFPRITFPEWFWVRFCPGEMLLRSLEGEVFVTTKVDSPVTSQWLPSESQESPALDLQAQILVWIHWPSQPCSSKVVPALVPILNFSFLEYLDSGFPDWSLVIHLTLRITS